MTLVVRRLNSTYWFTLITFLLQGRYPWVLLWTNSTHGFTLITLLPQEKCPWDLVGMCRLTFALLRIKYTDGFILILILLVQEKCHWNSVEMCRMIFVCFGPILSMGSF